MIQISLGTATRRQTGCSRHIYVVKLSLSLRSTLSHQEGPRICSPSKQPEEASEAMERLMQDFEVSLKKCVREVELIVLKLGVLMRY
ncbi:unnamed protein product [Leuciscus chuanchicus]